MNIWTMQTILLSNCSICIASLTPFWLPSLALAMSTCVLLWGLYVVIRWNCYRVLTICWMLTINSIWNTSVFCIVTLYLKYYTENTGSNERIIIMKSSLDIRSGGIHDTNINKYFTVLTLISPVPVLPPPAPTDYNASDCFTSGGKMSRMSRKLSGWTF